jgi:hypothetical protein
VGRIKVQLASPNQSRLLALLYNRLEKAAKDVQAVAAADARQARVVGQRFVQIVANIPPHTEPVGDQAQEVAFGANTFEEHYQLQLEEDDWINAGASTWGIALVDKLPDKGQIEDALQLAVEVVCRHQVVE